MKSEFYEIRDLIDEIEELDRELDYMDEAWNDGSPEEAALSDPGLQYEKSQEVEEKIKELENLCKQILSEGE